MQTKRVLLSIAVLFILGVALVMLLGRSPNTDAPADTETTASATLETTADGDVVHSDEEQIAVAAATETADTGTSAVAATGETAAVDAPVAEATETPAAADTAEATTTPDTAAADTTGAIATAAAAAAASETDLLAAPAALKVDVEKALKERSLGSAAAPVTIVEYASMTCPHCAHFNNDVLGEIKKQLIDTGKARLVYRDFPLDNVAAKAAAMARCADEDKYFDLVEVIFKDQSRWIQSDNQLQALAQLGTLAGMDPEYIQACMNNEQLQAGIIGAMQDAQKAYTIKSTPTFIFNNGAEKFDGARTADEFIATVNKLSGQ